MQFITLLKESAEKTMEVWDVSISHGGGTEISTIQHWDAQTSNMSDTNIKADVGMLCLLLNWLKHKHHKSSLGVVSTSELLETQQ